MYLISKRCHANRESEALGILVQVLWSDSLLNTHRGSGVDICSRVVVTLRSHMTTLSLSMTNMLQSHMTTTSLSMTAMSHSHMISHCHMTTTSLSHDMSLSVGCHTHTAHVYCNSRHHTMHGHISPEAV